jgi:CheY-like chemotaxis protein
MGTGTPVIGLSAVAVEFEDEDLLEAGFDAFLSKPIDKTKLFDLINENLNK